MYVGQKAIDMCGNHRLNRVDPIGKSQWLGQINVIVCRSMIDRQIDKTGHVMQWYDSDRLKKEILCNRVTLCFVLFCKFHKILR